MWLVVRSRCVVRSGCVTMWWSVQSIIMYYKVLLCTTKSHMCYRYYPVLRSTTSYRKVLLCTTQYYSVQQSTTQDYFVLQSTSGWCSQGSAWKKEAQDDTYDAVVLEDLGTWDDRLSTGLECHILWRLGVSQHPSRPAPRSVPWLKQLGGSVSILVSGLFLEIQFGASNDDRNPRSISRSLFLF